MRQSIKTENTTDLITDIQGNSSNTTITATTCNTKK